MVLTPDQFQTLLRQPKKDAHLHKIRMEFLLNTGMRYAEARRFIFKHHRYDAEKIHKPKTGKTYKQAERWIKVTPQYNEKLKTARELLKLSERNGLGFPTIAGFQNNLYRWFKKAEIELEGNLVKIFRKTRECWLMVARYDGAMIALDQGHSRLTQLKHYLSNPFSGEDVEKIRKYMKDWM